MISLFLPFAVTPKKTRVEISIIRFLPQVLRCHFPIIVYPLFNIAFTSLYNRYVLAKVVREIFVNIYIVHILFLDLQQFMQFVCDKMIQAWCDKKPLVAKTYPPFKCVPFFCSSGKN